MNTSRIAVNHPLAEAARSVNAYAEEHGLPETLEWLGMRVEAEQLAYLGEQRALRAVAATLGVNMNDRLPAFDEALAQAIVRSPLWAEMRVLMISSAMDAMAIGWKAHELASHTQSIED